MSETDVSLNAGVMKLCNASEQKWVLDQKHIGQDLRLVHDVHDTPGWIGLLPLNEAKSGSTDPPM